MNEVKFPSKQEALYRTVHFCRPSYQDINHGIKRIQKWLPLIGKSPMSILEVGCGNGKLCKLFLDMGVEDVTGLDITPGPYDHEGYKFIQHDLTTGTLPFKDKEFDYCFSFDVIEHLPEKYDEIIAEMLRVSKVIIGVIACFRSHEYFTLHPTVFDPKRWIWKITELSEDEMGFDIVSYSDGKEKPALFYYTRKKEN